MQQILLHQRLREEIEKNSNGKVRYVDSELYLRNQELRRSPNCAANLVANSEVQSATLNIGLPSSTTTTTTHNNNNAKSAPTTTNKQSALSSSGSNSRIPITSAITSVASRSDLHRIPSSGRDDQQAAAIEASTLPGYSSTDLMPGDNINGIGAHSHNRRSSRQPVSGDCQVCRIKEVREDLMNLNKIIQERNVHFSELKAKCLRNYTNK